MVESKCGKPRLCVLTERFAVCRMDAGKANTPESLDFLKRSDLFSVTRTRDELSVVCREVDAPGGAVVEGGWRALKVEGPLAFSEVGVLAGITSSLAGVPVFVLSTFETDYVLVKGERLDESVATLRESGYEIPETGEIQPSSPEDLDFLWEMLYEAVYVPDGEPKPPKSEIFADPVLRRYLEGWGREGDAALVAFDEGGERLGAVWRRRMSAEEPGYGFIDAETPEVAIALASEARGQGLGGRLLGEMISSSRAEGYAALGLSVERGNPAKRLYERLGFRTLESREGDYLMKLEL